MSTAPSTLPPPPPDVNEEPVDQSQLVGFNYRATTSLGREIEHYIDAPDEETARAILENAFLQNIELWPRRQSTGRKKKKVKRVEIAVFAGQLAERLKASETIPTACDRIGRATKNALLREALFDVVEALGGKGITSAEAFSIRPDVFPEAFINVVAVGEIGGDPTTLLKEYEQAQLRAAGTISKLRGAAIYPAVIIAVASVVVLVLMYFVMPSMEELYSSLMEVSGGQLPFPTRILTGTSRFLVSTPGIVMLAVLFISLVMLWKWMRGAGRLTVQRKILYWPVIGPLIRMYHASVAVRILAMLINVSNIDECLREAAKASTNIVFQEMLEDVLEVVKRHGRSLTVAFSPYAFLMGDEFSAAVSTGEEGGGLDTQFRRYAEVLETKINADVDAATKLMEPAMLVGVGVVIGGIVIAAYLPLFTLLGHLSGSK